MNSICKEIFRAIHEGKWLKIEYRNKAGEITNYWIGVKSIDVGKRMLVVDGLHFGMYSVEELHVYIDLIQTAVIVDGTYCPVNKALMLTHSEAFMPVCMISMIMAVSRFLVCS